MELFLAGLLIVGDVVISLCSRMEIPRSKALPEPLKLPAWRGYSARVGTIDEEEKTTE